MNTVRQFIEDATELIKASLPAGIDQRRLELLPQILAEWWVHDLPQHLAQESRATVRNRFAQLLKLCKRASELRQVLDGTEQLGRSWIAQEMSRQQEGDLFSREKVIEMEERLIQESDFLNNLAAATTKLMEKKPPSRGSPNIRAYL